MIIPEEVIDSLEMVLLEEIEALKQAVQKGCVVTASDIAHGYLCRDYSGGEISKDHHIMALASMVGITLHWLASRTEEVTH